MVLLSLYGITRRAYARIQQGSELRMHAVGCVGTSNRCRASPLSSSLDFTSSIRLPFIGQNLLRGDQVYLNRIQRADCAAIARGSDDMAYQRLLRRSEFFPSTAGEPVRRRARLDLNRRASPFVV